jgi:hypothetical protein
MVCPLILGVSKNGAVNNANAHAAILREIFAMFTPFSPDPRYKIRRLIIGEKPGTATHLRATEAVA